MVVGGEPWAWDDFFSSPSFALFSECLNFGGVSKKTKKEQDQAETSKYRPFLYLWPLVAKPEATNSDMA